MAHLDRMTTDAPTLSSATSEMRDDIRADTDTSVLLDWVGASGPAGIEFDAWYCNDHLSALVDDGRIRQLRRYAAPSRSTYVAIGELEEFPDFTSDGVHLRKMPSMVSQHGRFAGRPLGLQRRRDADPDVIDSAVVYPAFLSVPNDRLDELGRWYDEEHLPMLLSCPQWVMTRRFHIATGSGCRWNHVALHYLTDLRALRSPARDLARNTPWRSMLLAEGWFAPEYWVCYRLSDG